MSGARGNDEGGGQQAAGSRTDFENSRVGPPSQVLPCIPSTWRAPLRPPFTDPHHVPRGPAMPVTTGHCADQASIDHISPSLRNNERDTETEG